MTGPFNKIKELGVRGLIEKCFFNLKKSVLWLWQIGKFSGTRRAVSFEGLVSVMNGKNIILGDNVVIGKGVKISCAPEGSIVIGDGCYIGDNVVISCKKKLVIGSGTSVKEGSIVGAVTMEIGKRVWVSRFCTVEGTDVSIGDDSILSPFVFIIDTDHKIDRATGRISMDNGEQAPIRIAENVWVCNGAKIIKGVKVERSSVIGAGSVVTKDVPEYSLVAGVPAKLVKSTRE